MKSSYKTVFLGNSNVGKTTIMSQYLYQKIDEKHQPTIGLDFVSRTISVAGTNVRLQLWDTAGQEKFKSIIPSYTRNAFIVIVVFDLQNRESFEKVDDWISGTVRVTDPEKNIKIIIAGNKSDCVDEDVLEQYRVEGSLKAKEHSGVYVQTSAKSYEGLAELIKVINEYIEEDIVNFPNQEDLDDDIIRLESSKNTSCCGSFRK